MNDDPESLRKMDEAVRHVPNHLIQRKWETLKRALERKRDGDPAGPDPACPPPRPPRNGD